METVQGIPVYPGVAICPAFVLDREGGHVGRRPITFEQIAGEIVRLDEALEAIQGELAANALEIETKLGKEVARIFEAHGMLISDRNLRQKIVDRITQQLVGAETAVHDVLTSYANVFRGMKGTHFADRGSDMADIERRILGKLVGDRLEMLAGVQHQVIVIAHELTPGETVNFNRKVVGGIVTETGGQTSHTAIVAGALQIPGVVGVGKLPPVSDGDVIIVDGLRGVLIVRPDEPTLQRYHAFERNNVDLAIEFDELRTLPAVTRDGEVIQLLGNIEFPYEAAACLQRGAEGIGLYRTEFLFLGRAQPPSEEEHIKCYSEVLAAMGPNRPVTFRTLDLGADKLAPNSENKEPNPFLGLRSLRLSLRNRDLFVTQLRALLKVSVLGDVRIMFPLVTTLKELRQAKLILREVMEDLDEEGVPFRRNIPIGMMVEVPAAAVLAPHFAEHVDFFSIGTNDLIQYTLAVDRTNVNVAAMYSASDPAVLRLVLHCVKAARERRKPVSVCGEMSGDPMYAQFLVGIGVRTLSCAPHNIPLVKKEIRRISLSEARRTAIRAFRIDNAPDITKCFRSWMPDHQIADNRFAADGRLLRTPT